jgi:hypothetical protein
LLEQERLWIIRKKSPVLITTSQVGNA